MGSISDFLELELLDHVFGTAYSVPTNIFIALSTADPLDTGAAIAEPSGNGYARKVHNSWDAAAARLTENTGVITFAQASGAWGLITHYAIFDAITGGNFLAHGSLAVSKNVVNGNTPSIADGQIKVSFNSGAISNYLAHELLDHVFKVGSYNQPSIHVALSTANPGDDALGLAEPGSGNYARKAHSAWDVAAAGATENTGALTFNVPSGSWGLITHCAIMDALTAGNMLWYGTATPNQTPDNGDTVEYPAGALDVSLS